VIVFVRNLQLAPGETASAIVVNLVDANNHNLDVAAEIVRPVPGTDFVQVIFRVPTSVAAGKCSVTIKAHSQASNTGSLRIRN
jgi:hypothetical protein